MTLHYRQDGSFKIMQITDTHIGNLPFNEEDDKTFDLVRRALSTFDVDLIIHTGDLIWSEGVKDAHIIFEKFITIFNETQIPIAITFGNHDAEEIITRTDLRRIFDESVMNPVEKNDCQIIDDRENYVIQIYDHDLKEIQNVLFVLDSGAENPLNIGQYDWNQPEQVSWFQKTAAKYHHGDGVKRHLVFQHIPIPEYWEASEQIIAGVNHETNERISSPKLNTGLFANMVLAEELWGMFVGHDHDNNFDSILHGLHLVYGNVSGYNTYGDLERGVRIIELNQNSKDIKTYTVSDSEFKTD